MNIYNLTITSEEIERIQDLIEDCKISPEGFAIVDGNGPKIQALKDILRRLDFRLMLDSKSYGTRSARLVEVIEITRLTGNGTVDSAARELIEYWSKDGEFLAQRDTMPPVPCDCCKMGTVKQ